jgi:CHAD domain-containing protein
MSQKTSNLLHYHAKTLLHKSHIQAQRLADTKDTEALHDFRVSIRHLRSFIKSYQSYLGKSTKKAREQLAKLMQATNEGRDSEVHIAWLHQQHKKASSDSKLGIEIMLETFQAQHPLEVKVLQKQFAKLSKKLEGSFEKIKFDESFNTITSDILAGYTKTLKAELAQISKDKTMLHQTRITGKKLRYTLELFDTKETKTLVDNLKELQDILGEIHDLEVLLQRLEGVIAKEVAKWSSSFLEASKTLEVDEQHLPEQKRSYALASLQKQILSALQKDHDLLTKTWLGRANGSFFKTLNVSIKTLRKTPDVLL